MPFIREFKVVVLQFFCETLHNYFIFDSFPLGLRPRSLVAKRLSTFCVLPLLLAGILGAPGKRKQLADYSRKLLLEDNSMENPLTEHTFEIINAIRFIWFVHSTNTIFIISELIANFLFASLSHELSCNAAYMKKTMV